jgi:hypothetical protein
MAAPISDGARATGDTIKSPFLSDGAGEDRVDCSGGGEESGDPRALIGGGAVSSVDGGVGGEDGRGRTMVHGTVDAYNTFI